LIDWITAKIPCRHSRLKSDRVYKVSPSGEIHWEADCRISIPGSFESSISVRSVGVDETNQGTISHLELSGNPSKFLQGHNIFGSDDLVSLVYDTFIKVVDFLGITVDIKDLALVKKGDYSISRVDINYSYDLPCRSDVLSVIRALEFKSKTRLGRPVMKGSTLYWGDRSNYWKILTYSKGEEIEIKNHQLPPELKITELTKWADNKLRIELRLLRKELIRLSINKACVLSIELAQKLYKEYIGRINMNEQIALTDEKEMLIPQKLRLVYTAWKSGQDLRSALPIRTYYRRRKEMLEYGINIDLREDKSPTRNVIPLIRIIEANPAQIPEWAFSQNLIHRSATR